MIQEIKTKFCSKCQKDMGIESFSKNKNRPDGFSHWCKNCSKQANKKYEAKNKIKNKKQCADSAICSCCKEIKNSDLFSKNGRKKNGLHPYCKQCHSEKNKLKTKIANKKELARIKRKEEAENKTHKTCTRCKILKDMDSFYNHKSRLDGKTYVCIECFKRIQAEKPKKGRTISYKHSLEEVRQAFIDRGFIPLFTEYFGIYHKLKYECPKHGIKYIVHNNFKNGESCAECHTDSNRINIDILFERFYQRDLTPKFDKDFYIDSEQKLPYICNKHPEKIQYTTNGTLSRKTTVYVCKKCKREILSKKKKLADRDRRTLDYLDWRKIIIEKYDNTCQCCKSKRKIHVHHIYNYKDNIELRLDVENGILLCKKCHKSFHKIYGRRHSTPEQLAEFIKNKNKNKTIDDTDITSVKAEEK